MKYLAWFNTIQGVLITYAIGVILILMWIFLGVKNKRGGK